jgi:hypothetical protein
MYNSIQPARWDGNKGGREGVVSSLNFTLFTERQSVDKKKEKEGIPQN